MSQRTKVECTIDDIEQPDGRRQVQSVQVTCDKCGAHVCIFGRSKNSILAGFNRLREECPRRENNHYTATDDRLQS